MIFFSFYQDVIETTKDIIERVKLVVALNTKKKKPVTVKNRLII
jgi:hypothetical protein